MSLNTNNLYSSSQEIRVVRSGGAITVPPEYMFVPSTSAPQNTAQVLYDNARSRNDWDSILRNVITLAENLQRLANRNNWHALQFSSGYRSRRLNNAIGGADRSRHLVGLAMDVKAYASGGRQIDVATVANAAYHSGLFEEIIYYNTFTHLGLSRTPQVNATVRRSTNDGLVDVTPGRNAGAPSPGPQNDDSFEDDETNLGGVYVPVAVRRLQAQQDEVLRQLRVAENDEQQTPKELENPIEGELDIGDLRFGASLITVEENPTLDESSLNQPTSLTQEAGGVAGEVNLLRTDTNPIIGDNRALPEALVTLTINGSTRDDVNNALRPLVAMQRRFPFVPVRNADLTRLMIGGGLVGRARQQLSQLDPTLEGEELDDLSEEIIAQPGRQWLPVTFRSISIESRPGAPNLYQVSLVLQYANILPYVPQMAFWKTTESAVEWARYHSLRSWQGTEIVDVSEQVPGQATVNTPTSETFTAVPPTLNGTQTPNPQGSLVFKKFYRGLMEEHDPALYEETNTRPPSIGYDLSGQEINEPGYPVSNPERLMEIFDPDARLNLQYLSPTGLFSPEERMNQFIAGYEDNQRMMDLVGQVGNFIKADHIDLGEEIGRIGGFTIALSRQMNAAIASVGATTNAYKRLISRIENQVTNDRILPTSVGRYKFENGELGETSQGVELNYGPLAGGIANISNVADGNGPVDFEVPHSDHKDVFVPFTEELTRIQEAVLRGYADVIARVEEDPPAGWDAFLDEQRAASGSETDDDFASYMLSIDFLRALVDLDGLDSELKGEIEEMTELATQMSLTLSRIVQEEKERFEKQEVLGEGSKDTLLALEQSSIESVSVRTQQRFGDRAWDGYPHPVSQHIGGAGANVTLRIVTDDRVLLDQLGELKQSQIALGMLRREQDIVPELVTVVGRGNFLRSLGIKRLSYRNHSVTMMESSPGYYQVSLELIQDESSITEHEQLREVAGLRGERVFQVEPTLPFFGDVDIKEFMLKLSEDGEEADFEELNSTFNNISASRQLGFGGVAGDPTMEGSIAENNARRVQRNRHIAKFEAFDHTVLQFRARYDHNLKRFVLQGVIRDNGGGNRTLSDEEGAPIFGDLLRPLERFVEHVKKTRTSELADEFIRYTEQVLSSEGMSEGLLMAIHSFISEILFANVRNRDPDNHLPLRLRPNLETLVQDGSPDSTDVLLVGQGRRLLNALEPLALVFSRSSDLEEALGDFLEEKEDNLPDGVSKGQVMGSVAERRDQMEEVDSAAAHCYPDLLMATVMDPVQNAHIMGYDFPFGPGVEELGEDRYLTDYDFVEAMRARQVYETAAIGIEVIDDYTSSSVEMGEFKDAFNATMANLEKNANNGRFPGRDDPNSYFDSTIARLEEVGVFSVQPPIQEMTRRDWRDIFLAAQTLKYTSMLMQQIRTAAEEVDENSDEGVPDTVREVLEIADEQGFSAAFNLADISDAFSNHIDVESNSRLARERRKLIDLYSDRDGDQVMSMMGFTDQTAEGMRAELRSELHQSWTGPQGMREAFPSYQLLLSGPIGSGAVRMLSRSYAYSAVQSIEIRKEAASASQSCDLVLSNVRKRLRAEGDYDRRRLFQLDSDLTLDIMPGTTMYVYTGYGPDVRHLYPFSGRITEIEPGPVTFITLSSYSSTLNNAPNDGQGFFVNGSDGEQSLADIVLYTISQTQGLEGLGRDAFGAAYDALGRDYRGDDRDNYTMSVLAAAYRTMGMFKIDSFTDDEDSAASAQQVVNAVADGNSIRRALIGSPRLFENVFLQSNRVGYGWANWVFGSIAGALQNGEGWGWAALPDETTWATLHDIAAMYPDYIVTTRPYNIGVPLSELDKHPLRQTLYFGPRHGKYVYTSHPAFSGGTLAHLTEKEINSVLEEGATAREENSNTYLKRMYREIFIKQVARPALQLAVSAEGDSSWLQDKGKQFSDFISKAGEFFYGRSGGELNTQTITDSDLEGYEALLSNFFPFTYEALHDIPAAKGPDNPRGFTVDRSFNQFRGEGAFGRPPARWHEWKYDISSANRLTMNDVYERTGVRSATDNQIWHIESRVTDTQRDRVLEAFRRDLVQMAHNGAMMQNMTTASDDTNALLQSIQRKLRDNGYTPDRGYKSVVRHRFASSYKDISENRITATTENPDFANQAVITFPSDPTERLNAFIGQPGAQYRYSVQAAPTLDPDFINQRITFVPNLRINWVDAAGVIDERSRDATGGETIESLSAQYEEIVSDLRKNKSTDENGNPLDEKLAEVEEKIQSLFQNMSQAHEIKPKYATVAGNTLADGLRRMYDGELILKGSPSIEPHDIIHMFDDVSRMTGPVTVDAVYHSFTQNGFNTLVKPSLTCSLRGLDPTFDLLSFSYVSTYRSWINRFNRTLGAIGTLFNVGFRAWTYHSLVRFLTRGGLGFSAVAAGSRFIPVVGYGLAIGDTARLILGGLARAGEESIRQYVGLVASIADANPVVMAPLTYREAPYTAGLTGANGPSNLRATLANQLQESEESIISRSSVQIINQVLAEPIQISG